MAVKATTHDADVRQGTWNESSTKGAKRQSRDEEFRELSHVLCSGLSQRLLAGLDDKCTNQLFNHLRYGFRQKYGAGICGQFARKVNFNGQVELAPVPLACDVKRGFLAAWYAEAHPRLNLNITPGLHGTQAKSLPSIYRRGFLIPGENNGVEVVHGSAHGNGIYLASRDSALLAARHADDCSCVLVCGFLDNAKRLAQPRRMGSQRVTAESEAVRHVGSAIVIFDEKRVVPLFRLTSKS